MSKDDLRKEIKQLQEVVLNIANMRMELHKQFDDELKWVKATFGDLSIKLNKAEAALNALQEDHIALKKQFMFSATTGLHASVD